MNPYRNGTAALMALLGVGCTVKYADLGPLAPEQLWTPLPVQHVEVEGIEVAWIDSGAPPRGSGGPPVVLVHGLSSYMGFWEHQVPALAREHRVLALDLPGYGASARPDAPYTPPWYAELLSRWMDTVGLEEAVIVGHSMGGQIAITLALTHPDQVDRLVLSAPAGLETFSPGTARFMKGYWHEARATEAREHELRTVFTQAVFNRTDEGVERLLQERVRLGQHPAFQGTSVAVSRSIAGMVDHPVAHRLGELRVPTLLVFGTADHMIPNPIFTGGTTRRIAEQGRDAIPGAELVLLPGAGHTVHHDAPEAFNEAVLSFLRR